MSANAKVIPTIEMQTGKDAKETNKSTAASPSISSKSKSKSKSNAKVISMESVQTFLLRSLYLLFYFPTFLFWLCYVLISFKSIIVSVILLRKCKLHLFFKIMFDRYTDDDYHKEEDDPIAVKTIEDYLDFINYFYDIINYLLRSLVSSKLQDSEIIRSMLVKEHLLQEQTEDHNAATEAIIKIKKGKGITSRVRLNEGNLFGLVINNSDRKMLTELLSNARKLNEDIQKILLEKGWDFYDETVKYDEKSKDDFIKAESFGKIRESEGTEKKAIKLFFHGNSQLAKALKDYYVFETKKTIYNKLNDFITGWLIEAANNRLYFGKGTNHTYESLFVTLKKCFIKEAESSSKTQHDETNVLTSTGKRYHELIEDLQNLFKETQEKIDTFYLDEIKQFVLTIVTRTHPDKEKGSILDEIVKIIDDTPYDADFFFTEYKIYVDSKVSNKKHLKKGVKGVPCSFIFEQIRSKYFELDNAPWTTSGKFSKDKMSGEVGRTRWNRAMGSTNSKDGEISEDDIDVKWFRELLEESRRYKNRDAVNQNKHFSEFTIDKLLVLKTDAVGANIIHVSYLYEKYEEFGHWLVTQYPTLAVLPYNDEVKHAVRVSAVKEDLHVTTELMPYTGENILHMTVINRNLEETRWLLDFYRNHEHNTNNGLKTLLMTAATGNLQLIYYYLLFLILTY